MSETEERYDREDSYGLVKFYLADFVPDLEECRLLILKVIEQAMRDYCALANSPIQNDILVWQEARDFLFDNDYNLSWGDMELSSEQFMDLVDLDIEYVRAQAKRKLDARNRINDK